MNESERLRLLIDAISDYAIYMLDTAGLVVSWNPGVQKLKGYLPAEIIGRHFSQFFTPEDRAGGLPAKILNEAETFGRFSAEGWRVRKDGSRFWASAVLHPTRDETGQLIGFAKITRDVSERHAAEVALAESERHFRLLVEGVVDYAIFMIDPNGVVTNWNSGARRMKGYDPDEIIGQHFSRFYTEEDRAANLPRRALETANREGRYEAEGWRVKKDGSYFWANVVLDKIQDETGTLVGFAKITRDITERRNTQIALQRAQARRAQSLKLEALGQLTGGVAHDFNNLLMVVSGYIQTLKKLVGNDAKGLRAASAIERAARQGESLTRQLLSFSRRQTLNPLVTGVGESIEALRPMLTSAAGISAQVAISVAPDIWPVKVDVNEFELALMNLGINARDAMGKNGVVAISAENVHLQPGDTAENLAGDFVAVTVSDTGRGIAPDILPKVFDPFFTTKQPNKGTGLGLSQVYGFARQCGGDTAIASELGSGTTVTLYLPRANAGPEQRTAEGAAESGFDGTMLLVEDNPDVAEASVALIEQLGYQVHIANDAQAALDAVANRRFDLIVSDIVMAGDMDGLGLARTIRQHHPGLPVILVTGYSNAAALGEGEFTVLRKPYRLADLSGAIARNGGAGGRGRQSDRRD